MTITAALLESAMGARRDLAELYAPHLAAACAAYEINTPLRLAHFLAQLGHESGSMIHVREVWGPTPKQERYEGRIDLGNTQAGDGRRYMGRGLLQTTGRSNYRSLRDRLRARGIDAPDFEAAPELVEQPRWAALSACDYWGMHGINRMADRDDHHAVTLTVNGGTNGIEDRRRRLERAKAALGAVQEATTPAPQAPPASAPWQSSDPAQHTQEGGMPIPALVTALLPSVIAAIPRLAQIFKPGSEVAERNVAAASAVMDIVTQATGSVNAQAAVEAIKADPVQLAAATKAIESRWLELVPADGGGIDGARKADASISGNDMMHSPSFWVALSLLPLVYMIVGSVVGLFGTPWSDDVRSAIANGVVGMVIGAIAGYYFGQTTSRNRSPAT